MRLYASPTGERVVVRSAPKVEATPESRIDFYSKDNRLLCALDYFSEDGEHGYGVQKAAWTADGKYFIFSLASSGGHESWHSPTLVYSREWIVDLDDFAHGAGITGSDFSLAPSHLVNTHVLKNTSVPIQFDLDDVFRHSRAGKPAKGMSCSDGKKKRMGDKL